VNGQFLKIKGTMTMEKLMDVMIDKCRVECNDILRSVVSQHNALAGLYLIRAEPNNAVEQYRTVLGLMDKYKDKKIKIDTCQVEYFYVFMFSFFNLLYCYIENPCYV
jgi:hypothetical protein